MDQELYPYSLIEKYANVDYHIKVFDITNGETKELEEIMKRSREDNNLVIAYRKTSTFDKLGKILVHLEWFTYTKEKVSPFISTMLINEGAVPLCQ